MLRWKLRGKQNSKVESLPKLHARKRKFSTKFGTNEVVWFQSRRQKTKAFGEFWSHRGILIFSNTLNLLFRQLFFVVIYYDMKILPSIGCSFFSRTLKLKLNMFTFFLYPKSSSDHVKPNFDNPTKDLYSSFEDFLLKNWTFELKT